VTVLSENTKLRFDMQQGKIGFSSDQPPVGDTAQMEDTEAQMRRALGLYGDTPRHRIEPDRADSPQRSTDRYSPGGHSPGGHGAGGHRRRFVQDGDVPVTIVRRDAGPDPSNNRPAALVAPSQSRLQRTEAALAAETAAHERVERALAEAHATIRDLQTKIGHFELAKNEALDKARQIREAHDTLAAAAEAHEHELTVADERVRAAEAAFETTQATLADERSLRRSVERSLRESESARENAELLVRELTEQAAAVPVPVAPPAAPRRKPGLKPAPAPVVAHSRRRPSEPEPATEPEPVKWWLVQKPAAKRR